MAAPRVILITGANSGVGYEAAKAFLTSSKSYHIIFGSRSKEKGDEALQRLQNECPASQNRVDLLRLDVTSDESIRQAVDTVKKDPGHVDALVNNAGATFDIAHYRGKVSLRESFTKSYDVNVAGAHVLTHEFMPLLLQSTDPRLIFVGGLSGMIAAQKGPYYPTPELPAGWPKDVDFETIGYRCSKTALNMLMLDWNHKLKADKVKVWTVMPGFLATNLGDMPGKAIEMGAGHPSAGGEILRRVVEGERDADVGKVIGRNGEIPF